MFDTMTLTKVTGAVCGSLLVYLLGAWAAESLYHTGGEGHGEEVAQAYSIDTGAEEAPAADAAAAEVDFATVYAAADVAAGEKVFAKCKSCHKVDGANATGPHLNGVVDRAKASVPDFAYSDALKAMAGDSWTPENMFNFLHSPKDYAPGTKMSFAGLPKPEDRANVIAYLATLK
ncbi:c-type cytochrome [Paragemmobacter straminiformis]|uniref:Cytochrome c family protein n=1 Tax=Paragemmobacter straminiformis TaxID=2045119 RepID=A0A842I500_9RHOB|nr:cytochrome c family protein [Gemmobacter straminiformis]MBC2834661.1 cytochrome c family protein [Gemmobacter straminiformis]